MKTKPDLAVLFDMDGVLIDSMPHHYGTFNAVSHRYGFTPEETKNMQETSGSLIDLYHALQKQKPFKASFDEFADSVLAVVFERLENANLTENPALTIFIKELKDNGVPMAIGTAAMHRSAIRKLALVKLSETFPVMVTADDVQKHKPAPEVYLKAAELLRVPTDICIVIDDTTNGIESGKRAGMKTIGFSKYATDITQVQNADMIVKDFDELSYELLRDFVAIKQK